MSVDKSLFATICIIPIIHSLTTVYFIPYIPHPCIQHTPIPSSGTFVMEYVGEVLDYKEFKSRTRKYDREKIIHHYFMALNGEEVIDATRKGNVSRFINHCCDPNAETQKVIATVAMRDDDDGDDGGGYVGEIHDGDDVCLFSCLHQL